jgi:hypothetical protein
VLLLGFRRIDAEPAILDLEYCLADLTVAVRDLHAMNGFDRCLFQDRRYGLLSILGQPVHTRAQDKFRAGVLGRTEQLVNVAFPVSYMDQALRCP